MKPAFLRNASPWVEATLAALSPRERIAQLLHVASWSNRGAAHRDEVLALIDTHGIGGVIFFQGDPEDQWDFTAAYQQASRVPLLISIDAEWGLAMRLERTVQLPYAMTLGAIEDLALIREAGAELGRHCRRLGIHMNFAPTADINTEPDNPVIGFRSFGSDPGEVARRAEAFALGMQEQGVLAVAKHFPGHGDTKVDSHLSLPVLPHDRARLDAVELRPFRHLIDAGIAAIMTGHLHVPALDPTPNVGATISPALTQRLLKDDLGFEGLVVTDALDMQGVAAHFPAAEINRRALLAGNDVLLFCVDVPGSLDAIERAVEEGLVSRDEIDRRCRKLLLAKAWVGLDRFAMPSRDHLVDELDPPSAEALNRRLAAASVTSLKQPAARPSPERTASLALWAAPVEGAEGLAHHQLTATAGADPGAVDRAPFQRALAEGGVARHLRFALGEAAAAWDAVLGELAAFDRIVVGLQGLHVKAGFRFGVTTELCDKLARLLATGKVTLCVFGNGYALRLLPGTGAAQEVVLTYQDTPYAQAAAARVVLGEAGAPGRDHLGLGL